MIVKVRVGVRVRARARVRVRVKVRVRVRVRIRVRVGVGRRGSVSKTNRVSGESLRQSSSERNFDVGLYFCRVRVGADCY